MMPLPMHKICSMIQSLQLRPCISDDLKIGYYSTDHATQTDIKEIPELKELTITTQALMQLIHSLQQDWLTFKTVVQAQYEEKIEEQTSNLCKYINDRLRDIEFFHKRKEAQIRQSYQQQLCDALAVLRSNIEKYYSINEEDTESSSAEFLRLLRSKLHEEQSRIEDLERKLNEYQEKGKDKMVAFEDDDHEKKMLEKENEVFKEEIFELHNKIFHLENSLKRSEKENSLLDKQVQRMQLKLETDERTIQKVNLSSMTQFPILKIVISIYLWRSTGKLIAIQGQMKAEIENERSLVKSLTSGLQVEEEEVEKNKLPVQSETENIVLEEKREFQKDHLTKQKDLTKQELTNKITYVAPEQKAAKRTLTAENDKLKQYKGQQRQTTESLRETAEQSNIIWKKKFQILQKSLHAIKDEMFLRQTLQRRLLVFKGTSLCETMCFPVCTENETQNVQGFRGGLYLPLTLFLGLKTKSTGPLLCLHLCHPSSSRRRRVFRRQRETAGRGENKSRGGSWPSGALDGTRRCRQARHWEPRGSSRQPRPSGPSAPGLAPAA
ncbi:uncharacterized protein C10orf67 homolog, mitochondrial isoform X2 [Struthio camelus]|uniref:uncharacterized protein C10orf67 homolog, mitochondrial isoform X2 n=1 Tax=Struthio camelus TaxID=8801 RepID=UPI003603ED00